MSHFKNQQETAPAVSYPPTMTEYPPASYVTPPPPVGYPSKDGPAGYPQQSFPHQTTSRGDGFLKGREEEMDTFKELPEFLDKFLKALLTIVSAMATSVGVEFSTKHPNLMMVTVFMIVLYFLLWLLGAMLRHRIQSLEKILSWIMLVIGSVSSVLVLTIINPVLACLASLFLLGIFAVVAYHNSEELYQLFVSPVSDTINTLIASNREGGQGAGLPV